MNPLRDIFKRLKYIDIAVNEIDRCMGTTGAPLIFSETEIQNYSLKWLKRLLLVRVGLTPIEQLEEEINRYQMADYKKAMDECVRDALDSEALDQEFLIVLKAISKNATGMIPNYRIYSSNDVLKIFRDFCEEYKTTDNEIWFCKTITDKNSGNLGGRITFNNSDHPQYIEIVWYTSPRRIEDAHSPDFPYPFLRGVKPLGRQQFHIELMNIPKSYIEFGASSYAGFEWEARQTIKEIMKKRENIELLTSTLYFIGAKEVSLEFIKEKGKLKYIDWDSDIEYEAIKHY